MSKKTDNLMSFLSAQYPSPKYAFIQEFRGGTGYARESRADAIAMNLYPSEGLELIGFELKTSRTDWLREIKQPEKANPIKQFCDRWYLVTDDQTIVHVWDNELPKDWGFMYPNYVGSPDFVIGWKAPKLKPEPIDRLFLASLMRLAARDVSEVWINGKKYTSTPSPSKEEPTEEKEL